MESAKQNIEEKRVKPTVIRRRARSGPAEPSVGQEETAGGEAAGVLSAQETAAALELETSPAAETKAVQAGVEELAELKPAKTAQELEEEENERRREKAAKSRKVGKRKTRDDLLMEEYERVGGLKQAALGAIQGAEEEDTTAEPLTRVFQPERQPRRKRVMGKRDFKKTLVTTPSAKKRKLKIKGEIIVGDFAQIIGLKAAQVIQKLAALGTMVAIHQRIDYETASIVAQEFGYEAENVAFQEEDIIPFATESAAEEEAGSQPRAPVITVMGHVDHGKTSLLDYVRKTKVAAGEAGGITQHIGAYEVTVREAEPSSRGPEDRGIPRSARDDRAPRRTITFVDTPGHEAFTAMRARGAELTDIVILVVAADDGVKPQTIEAINHAKSAKVPIVVAINKMDAPGADAEKVKRQLSEQGLLAEDWGGDVIMVSVSAKTGSGVDQLLEMILLQAELLELKANPDKQATGVILEAKLEKGRGPVATVIVQSGTLRRSDVVVAGFHSGRVRAILDSAGKSIKEAGPSVPVEILGLSGVPSAGQNFHVVSEEDAKKVIAHRSEQRDLEKVKEAATPASLAALYAKMGEETKTQLNLIVKGDVQGSIEALCDALQGIESEKIQVHIVHRAVGAISETDVMLAEVSKAMIVGFNVRPDAEAKRIAEHDQVEIRTYRVIYEAIDDIRKAMTGLLAPESKETYLGRAEVREVFTVSKIGTVAGSSVVDGKIQRGVSVRLLRDNVLIYEGKLTSLKRFKDDVKEVAQGYECGIGLENYNDIKVGDLVEAYQIQTIRSAL